MKQIDGPAAEYWNELRGYDKTIRELANAEPYIPPENTVSAFVWDAESSTHGINQGYDTAGYLALPRPLVGKDKSERVLTTFTAGEVGKKGVARVYELNLRLGHENLIIYSAHAALNRFGVDPHDFSVIIQRDSARKVRAGLRLFNSISPMLPHAEDLDIVADELERGAAGIFRKI